MKCLVSGGMGFIGSHLSNSLIKSGHQITVIDNLCEGYPRKLAGGIAFIKKDIRDNLNKVFSAGKFDWVFHLAALPRVQRSIAEPLETHDVNVNGTLNLLLMSRKYQVKRFIFSSSSSVYGDQDRLPFTEDMTPNPLSPYALHKLVGEQYCRLFYHIYDLESISLRYFNVYGPDQNPNGEYANLIPKFLKLFREGKQAVINGDGEQTRDLTYISDVVNANILAASTLNKKCLGEVFNVGGGHQMSVNEMVNLMKSKFNTVPEPIHGPAVIEPRATEAGLEKINKLLGWQPTVNFKDALKAL